MDGIVLRHNASYGLHLYPSIKHSRIENNLVYDRMRGRGIIVSRPSGGGKNIIVNNTLMERQPLTICKGNGEIVVSNILVAEGEGEVLTFNEGTTNVLLDYNLCLPKSAHQGAHSITGDPMFVDAGRDLFWLRAESPARGKGSPDYAPATDFRGRPRAKDQPPDLGAMPFAPGLAEMRERFEYGWTCHRHGGGSMVPDLWALPVPKPRQ